MMVAQTMRRVRSAYSRTSILFFGNRLGLTINLVYALYGMAFNLAAKLVWPPDFRKRDPAARRAAESLQQEGFAVVPPFLPQDVLFALQNKVDHQFEDPQKVVHTLEEGGLIRLRKCLSELPELEQFLRAPEVAAVLEEYYGGAFKLFNADVYRTIPRQGERAQDVVPSLLWHFDNLPRAMVKLMVYLRDTRTDSGALTLVPKGKSLDLRRRGFWDRKRMDRFAGELDGAAVRIEAKAGTVIIFSTHYCIHKATLPESGYRDVAAFLVLPALFAERPWDEAARRTFSENSGCCVNPFTNRPARFGDERA